MSMISPGEPLWEFCGFANGTSFRTKYFLDESTMTLTPCGEFSLISIQSVPLLFSIITNWFLISEVFPRFQTNNVLRVLQTRCWICLFTILLLAASFALSFISDKFRLKEVLLMEYSLMFLVWMSYGFFWTYSCITGSWSRSTSLAWSTFFASKVFHLITVNRLILYGWKDGRAIIAMVMSACQLAYSVTEFVDWRIRRKMNPHVPLDDTVQLEKTDEGAGIFSKIFFCWANKLIEKGSKFQLKQISDLFELPPSLKVPHIEKQFVENSPTMFTDAEPFSIYKSLFYTFGKEFLALGLLRFGSDIFTFSGPILLHLLVEAFQQKEPSDDAIYLTMLTVLCTFMGAMFSANFTYYTSKVGMKIRCALVTSIYDRLLSIPSCELTNHTGKLMNFITTDVDRVVNFTNSFHAAWSLPAQAIVGMYLLYREVGNAAIAGLICAFVLIPLNNIITKLIGTMSEKFMAAKDNRIKMTTEIVSGFKAVKMSAMEEYFENRIGELRGKELYYLKIRKYLDAVCVYFWASAPLLITISILVTYTLSLHEKLTAAKVFPVLALVNILIMPLNAMPWVFNGLIEAKVSLNRLQWFFRLKQMDLHEIYSLNDDPETMLSVRIGHFNWKDSFRAVREVNFIGKQGQLIGITGEIGSGKSTLLLGLLGETEVRTDTIGTTQEVIDGGIGYLGQERWLIRGTIRENILFGKPYVESVYNECLKNSCLRDDIKDMPGQDSYLVSDNGESLSGGQRTRVAIARALYQNTAVYLLDEPFASLDRKVADTIFALGIKPLKAEGKLVVIATHDRRILAQCDEMLLIHKSGEIERQGNPSEVLNLLAQTSEGVLTEEPVVADEDVRTYERVTEKEEERQTGAVKANVYLTYSKSVSHCLSFLVVISLVTMQFTKNGADWWLSKWTESQGNFTATGLQGLLYGPRNEEYLDDEEEDKSVHFLKIYGYIALANTFFTLSRAFLFAYGGLRAAEALHKGIFLRLLRAPILWLDSTPTGRIINRLCADVYTVDDNLPFMLNIFFATLVNLIGSIVVSVVGLPFIVVVYFVLTVIYYFIQKHYRRTTVELKRLSSLSMSPFFSHVSDTVVGLVTIRAHKFTDIFIHKLRSLLSDNMRTQFASLAASQWLNIRLSLIAVTVVAAISVGAIIQHRVSEVNSGLVALAITYALTLTSLLNGLLGAFIETEKEMVSVERIDEYLHIPTEKKGGQESIAGGAQGNIELTGVGLRYGPNKPLAINNINLEVKPGQKVAIMGRTGSGKSSIYHAILRTVRICAGRITIDGVDTSQLSLRYLRTLCGVVPQSPFLFSGTLWDNLTVYCKHAEPVHVTTICRVAQLDNLLTRLGGFDGLIQEGGKNLSFGERQVIAICRILLSKPKILLIDEATSHMDDATHDRMLSLITAHLPNTSVLSIIHNKSGLKKHYDLVVDMHAGQISNISSPKEIPL